MSERDELRGTLSNTICIASNYPPKAMPYLLGGDMSEVLDRTADAILAAGYRKPRIITTAEELDALPDMTILVDQHGIAWQKFVDECSDQPYWAMDGTKCYQSGTVLNTYRRELTVLWEPK